MRAYEVFEAMKDRNLTTSLRSWSKDWLGRAQNFATVNRSDPLPPETSIVLRRRLVDSGHHDLAAMVLLSMLEDFEVPPRPLRRS